MEGAADAATHEAPVAGRAPEGRRTWAPVLAVLAFVALGAAGAAAWQLQTQPVAGAPGFTLRSTGFENGTQGDPVVFSLADLRGRVVVLDFMAVNCTPCKLVARDVLVPLHESHNVTIVSIDIWPETESERDLVRHQKASGLPWRHALDSDDVARKYGVFGAPALAIVDPEGRLAYLETALGGTMRLPEVARAVEDARGGVAQPAQVLQVGFVGLAFVAGAASMLAPCAVGLLPGYMGLLLRAPLAGPTARTGARVRPALGAAAATGVGVLAAYAVLALALAAAGQAVAAHVGRLGPLVGLAILALGVATLAGARWGWLARVRIDGRRGFLAYGAAYGLAAFGCTGPLFVPILVGAFAQGTGTGLVAFALYGLAVAGLLFVAAFAVATGQAAGLHRLMRHARWATRVTAVLMVLAGGYLVAFYYRANGPTLGLA